MALIGYARVSTSDQSLDIQQDALRAAGCERIFSEKQSGRDAASRHVWQTCLEHLRDGDVLMFTRLDRLARSLSDLVQIGEILRERNVEIRCLQQHIDTTTSEGRLVWGILATVAEFEVDLKAERQREGIEKAHARGVRWGGGRRKTTKEKIEILRQEGLGATEIADRLRVDRSTVYRNYPGVWDGPKPGEKR